MKKNKNKNPFLTSWYRPNAMSYWISIQINWLQDIALNISRKPILLTSSLLQMSKLPKIAYNQSNTTFLLFLLHDSFNWSLSVHFCTHLTNHFIINYCNIRSFHIEKTELRSLVTWNNWLIIMWCWLLIN